jgi:hypothetical protein
MVLTSSNIGNLPAAPQVLNCIIGFFAAALTAIGIRITRHQHAQARGAALVSLWDQSCSRAVSYIERELYTAADTGEGEAGYLYNDDALTTEKLGLALAVRVLAITSRTGQPRDAKIHVAKQSLNSWAEDAYSMYGSANQPEPSRDYMPLLRTRARMVGPLAFVLGMCVCAAALGHLVLGI